MASPYELLAGLALLREKNRSIASVDKQHDLKEWAGFLVYLGKHACLLPSEQVEEVMTVEGYASVRGVQPWIRGIAYFRAQLLSIVDLGSLFIKKQTFDTVTRVFVVRGQQEWFGLQLTAFEGVRHIWSDTPVCTVPIDSEASWQPFVTEWLMLEGKPVAVLDARKIVAALEKSGVDAIAVTL